jgi:hypothetical protein
MMCVGVGMSELHSWWYALQEGENGAEVRAQVDEVADEAIVEALTARFLPSN